MLSGYHRVAFTGSSCQQNKPTAGGHNNASYPLFLSKQQPSPTSFLESTAGKEAERMGTPSARRKVGGLAAGALSMSGDYFSKDNYDPMEEASDGEVGSLQPSKVKLVLGHQSKRRLSSVTECGDIEDMSGMDERLVVALNWIKERYYEHPTGSVSRSGMYDKYTRMCSETGTEPMNMATLGKHIRNIFPGIITRRLGNRGNSKYHYYGLAEVGVSPEAEQGEATARKKRRPPASITHGHRRKELKDGVGEDVDILEEDGSIYRPIARRASTQARDLPTTFTSASLNFSATTGSAPDFEEFLRLQHEICVFAVGEPRSPGLDADGFRAFAAEYQRQTCDVLRRIYDRDFSAVEKVMADFWAGLDDAEIALLGHDECVRLISVADDYLYQVSVSLLMPEVIEPCVLSTLQQIRVFAKWIDGWFTSTNGPNALPVIFGGQTCIPPRIVESRIDLARRFSAVLRRRTSVNHLAQAVASVVVNKAQVQQMIHDWDHVDFASIREQIKWIIGNKEPFISYMEVSVKSYLLEEAPMAMWTHWLENLVEQYMAVEMAAGRTLDGAARSLLLAWSFYQTLVLRDLTLRSASSFGSFHILRLFLEEYAIYYVERKMEEHRRAVGILAYWPSEPSQPTAPMPTYDEFFDEEQQQHRNGLQMMSSVADHHFPPSDDGDAQGRPFDGYSDLNTLLG